MQALGYDLTSPTLNSIYLPLQMDGLLLPDISVVEVIKPKKIESELKSPEWFIGNLDWRGIKLPLISFESLNGASTVGAENVKRVAVINGTVDQSHLPYYAVVVSDTPSLHEVKDEDHIKLYEGRPRGRAEAMSVTVDDLVAGVPNIDWVEQHLLAYILHG